jgi:hypothetical protein
MSLFGDSLHARSQTCVSGQRSLPLLPRGAPAPHAVTHLPRPAAPGAQAKAPPPQAKESEHGR